MSCINIPYAHFSKENDSLFIDAISFTVSWSIESDTNASSKRAGIGRFVKDKTKHIKDCFVYPKEVERMPFVYSTRDISLYDLLIEIARQSKLDL
ncbi:MAG: hypothetical protein ACI9E1_001210 [Cryomorphaceae bacterium]|jgi:hypothetical protein